MRKASNESKRIFREPWHRIPLVLGVFLIILSFPSCLPVSLTSSRRPSHLSTEPGQQEFRVYSVILLGQAIIMVLPLAIAAIACILQVVDMDPRMLHRLKPYKNEGETIDGILAEPPNNTKSTFLTKYHYGHSHITKTIQLRNEKEKDNLLSSSCVRLVVLPPNECSAVAQSWLEENLRDLTSRPRRLIHYAAGMYGAGLYFTVPHFFIECNLSNVCVLAGVFIMCVPIVHLYLLNRHDDHMQKYLFSTRHEIATYGIPLIRSV
jgi:hypothetical protein